MQISHSLTWKENACCNIISETPAEVRAAALECPHLHLWLSPAQWTRMSRCIPCAGKSDYVLQCLLNSVHFTVLSMKLFHFLKYTIEMQKPQENSATLSLEHNSPRAEPTKYTEDGCLCTHIHAFTANHHIVSYCWLVIMWHHDYINQQCLW